MFKRKILIRITRYRKKVLIAFPIEMLINIITFWGRRVSFIRYFFFRGFILSSFFFSFSSSYSEISLHLKFNNVFYSFYCKLNYYLVLFIWIQIYIRIILYESIYYYYSIIIYSNTQNFYTYAHRKFISYKHPVCNTRKGEMNK